jgi:hypothetical protein
LVMLAPWMTMQASAKARSSALTQVKRLSAEPRAAGPVRIPP